MYLCQKCQTLNITLINTMWQAEKCNLLWKDSVSARSRIKCDRFQKSMTYPLRALVSLSSHFDRIKEKKKTFSVGRSSYSKRNHPPASNTWTCPRARLGQLSRNEATRQVDARDGICTLGNARRMYSMCRRCQTVKRLWDKPGRVSRCP